jgi:hypothetical protein
MTAKTKQTTGSIWLLAVAGLGVLWNVYGAYQYIGSFSQTKASLMAVGMTGPQAELYLSLPAWISVVFAIGVFGGLAGSISLLMKKAIALPVFAVSLVGYILLFIGDYYYGVFENIPTQIVILAVVVAVAATLLAASVYAKNRNLLA